MSRDPPMREGIIILLPYSLYRKLYVLLRIVFLIFMNVSSNHNNDDSTKKSSLIVLIVLISSHDKTIKDMKHVILKENRETQCATKPPEPHDKERDNM